MTYYVIKLGGEDTSRLKIRNEVSRGGRADTAMVDNTIYHGELVTTGSLQHSQGWPPNNSSIFRLQCKSI